MVKIKIVLIAISISFFCPQSRTNQ